MAKPWMRLVCWGLGFTVLTVLALAGYWLFLQWRTSGSNQFAEYSWRDRDGQGGSPYAIKFVVLDSEGKPLEGVRVRVWDPSGGGEVYTDEHGQCEYRMDGGLTKLELNGVEVIAPRDIVFAPVPDIGGWLLTVRVKDKEALGIRQR